MQRGRLDAVRGEEEEAHREAADAEDALHKVDEGDRPHLKAGDVGGSRAGEGRDSARVFAIHWQGANVLIGSVRWTSGVASTPKRRRSPFVANAIGGACLWVPASSVGETSSRGLIRKGDVAFDLDIGSSGYSLCL